jgi:rhamnosyltransferase
MQKKIIAVVIWFNPDAEMVKNIFSYSNYVFKTIVIDNSNYNNSKFIEDLNNFEYIPLMYNYGIASALNIGYCRAEELGAEWVLTMDQDSSFRQFEVKRYLDIDAYHFNESNVAVFGPNFEGQSSKNLIDCNSVISSGSLVNLVAHNRNCGYNEDLFIDQVDHEYCFRLKLMGYRIIRVGYISMVHVVGFPLTKKCLGRNFYSYNHNYIRKYYITRNTLYMWRHFSDFGDKHLKKIIMDIINVIIVEEDKYNKLKSMIKGCIDFFMDRMGPMDSVLPNNLTIKPKSTSKRC